jgi:hypothetical protein
MGFDAQLDETPAKVDPFVETDDWSEPKAASAGRREPAQFVDGIRRIELRVLADADGHRVAGLFGGYGVGAVVCDASASFGDYEIGRALVLGGGQKASPIDVSSGSINLHFDAVSTPGMEPDDPLLKLQQLMRQAESNLAARLASATDALVIADGPLAFFDQTRGPVVGVVKRFGRVYLHPEQGQLLPRLAPGQRTPLFAIQEPSDRRRRYAWYTRLAAVSVPWHDHAGVVRCEVRGGLGIADAAELADRVSGRLPDYAGRAADPRTPQNLVPIAGLETWLRHRLGDTRLIRRALLDWITKEAEAA